MPFPLSVTWITDSPPFLIVTEIELAQASIEFSTSSFTTLLLIVYTGGGSGNGFVGVNKVYKFLRELIKRIANFHFINN